jgi:hypothetical protein
MARIQVTYMAKITELIEWPENEMDDFNHENLTLNLKPRKANNYDDLDIISVKKNGVDHYFR